LPAKGVLMAIRALKVTDFTVFAGEHNFEFAPGINVCIGENATGKSHLLKLLYAVEAAMWDLPPAVGQTTYLTLFRLETNLQGLFRVGSLDQLVSRGRQQARVRVEWDDGGWLSFTVGGKKPLLEGGGFAAPAQRPMFLPTREMLSIFPGFAEAIRNRELEFDETYAHLADALDGAKLKGEALKRARPLLEKVEAALGGTEDKKAGRFYVKLAAEEFEAHLVAEGLRKVATLARLIRNGRIARHTVLFWDEPETNLNPVLLRKVIQVLLALAGQKVQLFLASHDYLLTQTLSLTAEHPKRGTPPMRFIGLSRRQDGTLAVAQAKDLAGIQDNPILQEHARQYDLEVGFATATDRAVAIDRPVGPAAKPRRRSK
jgi:ABC-type transport system involved in cytochrome c biogenesis ATPase subunit